MSPPNASCGRSVLYSIQKASNWRCWAAQVRCTGLTAFLRTGPVGDLYHQSWHRCSA